jgi:hypothetical protein
MLVAINETGSPGKGLPTTRSVPYRDATEHHHVDVWLDTVGQGGDHPLTVRADHRHP